MSTVIDVILSTGVVLPFRPVEAKSGNEYHAIIDPTTGKPPAKRTGGVPVSPSVVGGELPVWAEVLGVRVPLTRGESEFGVANVRADRVPVTFEGEARLFSIKIGHGKNFRVSGSINRPGGATATKARASL